ncbi:MAG: DUF4358 domain-containing protein [Clostridia bacterium]|nr:DUF4358 domain-containing protein [Clostridia bacterium]
MNKTTFFAVGRWVAILAAVIFLICTFSSGKISKTPLEAVEKAVLGKVDTTHLEGSDAQILHRDYGLSANDYDGFVLYSPKDFMDPEEILIVKLADTNQAEQVASAMQKRLDERTAVFDNGYGPAQYDLLTKHSVIRTEGNYVLLLVSENAESALKAFLKAL